MYLEPLVKIIKEYAFQEILGVSFAMVVRAFRNSSQPPPKPEAEMVLTPNGWEKDKRRLTTTSSAIHPV